MSIEGLLRPTIAMIVALVLVFLVCELGEMVTSQYESLNDELHQCDWYLFPVGMQRMLVIFMSYTQQPVLIRGYGNVRCVRVSFKNVRNNAYKRIK